MSTKRARQGFLAPLPAALQVKVCFLTRLYTSQLDTNHEVYSGTLSQHVELPIQTKLTNGISFLFPLPAALQVILCVSLEAGDDKQKNCNQHNAS